MVSNDISILFVEDDKEVRAQISDFLTSNMFKDVYVANNGKDGLLKYNIHKPDIVLSDLNMPIMDGLEMSRAIKALDENTPILLITSNFEKNVTEAAVDIGIEGCLFKPLSLNRVEKILTKYIEKIMFQREFKNKQKLLEQYKSIIDISSSVTKTDINGIITYVNNPFCDMSGYSKDELLGKNHTIISHPDNSKEFYEEIYSTLRDKKIWRGHIKNRRKNGDSYYESSVIAPILDENDEIVECISLKQDITELYAKKELLKKRVKEEIEKNIQLKQEREKERLLEERFSIIGKMAAGITHEINTPLTYIKGNLELMMHDIKDLDDEIKQKNYLQEDSKVILEGVNRISSIVESMREMASQAKGMAQESNVYSSLITALILSYTKASYISVQNSPFKISMDKNRYSFIAPIQKQRIEQVFIIIINNALDALKLNQPFDARELNISLRDDDEYVVVSFKDNGGGIDEGIMPHIFNPFQSTKVEGGIGIGLNVAKRIMQDHGGEILARNYEKGAIFEVYIPKRSKLQDDS
ncbi:PAS/PAC sensor hybrid histidine kinase [Sulfurimonas denitrificans DSM 1251]|uniref:histidine kinase n=1 Tax=Sulfurimonas denitrificans (strain ATCC 33889 / DSM 1251) TaxID=326298 RepID=Q30TW9_SULDN|nr:response regulator [Sulfurimonas denitrificans]ABB43562.1 PAS/PAC sensor hybrid histidine kinase [Sulfurimonas denitrificans DSM 1251]MDD3443534.1 response regulator [Sulfurimonas denitrificans]